MTKIKIKGRDNKNDANKFGFDFSAKGDGRDIMCLLMATTVAFAKEVGMSQKNLIESIKKYSKQVNEGEDKIENKI